MTFGTEQGFGHRGRAWVGAALLFSACAGKAETDTGRLSGAGSGGANMGVAGEKNASAGSAQGMDCEAVNCLSIPTTCKHIVQAPGDCCATCPDTGCDACPDLDCPAGTHSATAPGDCCASCVADPPDACVAGRLDYGSLREELLDKYGGSGCKNSAECTLLKEDNACGHACNIPLPTSTAHNLLPNLDSAAQSCSTCAPPIQVDCDRAIAACVNGKCIAADAQP